MCVPGSLEQPDRPVTTETEVEVVKVLGEVEVGPVISGDRVWTRGSNIFWHVTLFICTQGSNCQYRAKWNLLIVLLTAVRNAMWSSIAVEFFPLQSLTDYFP